MSKTNGFRYPPKPTGLPPLDPISARLISPRIPFMQIRRLRHFGQYTILGQVINVPVDVDTMVKTLPRRLDGDYSINVAIKRKLIHKSNYLVGYVKKNTVKAWLDYLIQQPLYRNNRINIDMSVLDVTNDFLASGSSNSDPLIEGLSPDADENEQIIARQHTALWNENSVLDIAPGERNRPLNLIFDHQSEELSFPDIYYGHPRSFKEGVRHTPHTIANSEIRRQDRRGVVPDHILYMAMKSMRLRLIESIRYNFMFSDDRAITRAQIESREFLEGEARTNFAFLKAMPNSSYYWQIKKKDVFAMMRQLGKPTIFMTMSSSETKWPELIRLLHKLGDLRKDLHIVNPLADLTPSERAHLVNEDPVICCIYFKKLVDIVLNILKNRRKSPFGKYYVIDEYMRFEMQQRGSVHVHMLLWLNNDPKETVSERMPETIKLVTDLFSTSQDDLPEGCIDYQKHVHTFTCTKRGEKKCRFNIPFWPMKRTKILLPLAASDGRRTDLQKRAAIVRDRLEHLRHESVDNFLAMNDLDVSTYLDMIRSTLQRPTMFFKRDMTQVFINTFNPWVGGILNSNSDIQFILDEYSCATYVLDYVNKADRGISNLHREVTKLRENNPSLTSHELMKKMALKTLNSVEMCAQEAAWYLLRNPMGKGSREVVYIPTQWPADRQKSYKTRAVMDRENISSDSTAIWTKNIIQKYEDRPANIGRICLAEFAAWWSQKSEASFDGDECEADWGDTEDVTSHGRRSFARILRWRGYEPEDTRNYKREMVTLFIPFRLEMRDVIDRDKFISIYNEKVEEIAARKAEYVKSDSIEQIADELSRARQAANDEQATEEVDRRQQFAHRVLQPDEEENFDDFGELRSNVISAIRQRSDGMSRLEFLQKMRTTNERQREIILEFIHRLTSPSQNEPIQIFFTGPAGCGKTHTLKLLMYVLNRFGNPHEEGQLNAYIACASTGKAAVNLGGMTVHGAFRICPSRQRDEIPRETIQQLQSVVRGVKAVIVDEVSMIGTYVFNKINARLQQMTGEWERPFGGLHMIFCGDLRQLPPVKGKPVFAGDSGHLQGAALWQHLDFFNLTEVVRQSDLSFSSALTKLGVGERLTDNERQMFLARFRTRNWVNQHKPNAIRLFHTNAAVDAHNGLALPDGFPHVAKDQYIGPSNQIANARAHCHRMAATDTANLPYLISLKVGCPYMLTVNVDVEDRLVNGTIGTLRYLEELPPTDIPEPSTPTHRLWLEFEDRTWGAKARNKVQAVYASSRGAISRTWTPISCRSATFKVVSSQVKVKRVQFPIVSALAMTIHKSQGGTFDEIVLDVNKRQNQQLHYVGISRVTSLEGLYLTNENDEFVYHHANGCTGGTTRLINAEYERLRQHPLGTLSQRVMNFCAEREEEGTALLICTINAQSLVAHHEDIRTDRVLCLADILVISETWMDDRIPIVIDGYRLIAASHTSTSSTSDPPESRTPGGAAIYIKESSWFEYRQISTTSRVAGQVGDCVLTKIEIGSNVISLMGVYIHPNQSKERVERYLSDVLSSCTPAMIDQRPSADNNTPQPLIVTGDFNSNIDDDEWIIRFMERRYGAAYVRTEHPTTLGNTTIDLTFTRDLRASSMPYVSYFTYHRPLFNKILLT